MVLTMKLVSVAFDIDTAVKEASERVSESKDDNNDENEKEDSSAGSSKKARRRKPPASQTSKSSAEREKDKEPVEDPKTRFDLTRVPSFLEYFGYALNPGTTFFGPWVSYTDYLYLYENPRWVIIPLQCLRWVICNCFAAFSESDLAGQDHFDHDVQLHVFDFVKLLDHLVHS